MQGNGHEKTRRRRLGRGQEPAAGRRHPPARADPRRRDPRAGRQGGVRPGRAGPPALRRLPAEARRPRRPRPRPAADQPLGRPHGERDPRLQLFLAPRQHRRGPAPPAPARGARAPGAPAARLAAGRVRAAGAARHRRRPHRRHARARLDLAGAHRPPDRGAAKEHPRRRAGDRRAAGGAHARARRARCGTQRVADPRPRHPALADADAAPGQAHRRRRDRERAQLLPRHLPGADSRALPRGRGGPPRLRDRALLPHGQLDRRRPRRQPLRQRRDARHRAGAAERDGAAPLPDAGARARRRAVELDDALDRVAGAAGARRCLERQQRAPRRRALPARPDRRLCAAGGDACRCSPAPRPCATR